MTLKSLCYLLINTPIFLLGFLSASYADTLLQKREISVDGIERHYLIVPAKTQPAPLVVALHGWRRAGQEVRGIGKLDDVLYRGLDKLAARENISVAYPIAFNGMWNLTEGQKSKVWGTVPPPNDLGFIRTVIESLIADDAVDGKRVFLTGFSNGAIMSYRVLCSYGDLFVAAAPVSGTMRTSVTDNCDRQKLPPLLTIMGTEDPILPYGGSKDALGGELSMPSVLSFFKKAFNCGGSGDISSAAEPSGKATRVKTTEWRDCDVGKALQTIAIDGGGHRISTFDTSEPERWDTKFGLQNHDFETSEEIWRFFQQTSE